MRFRKLRIVWSVVCGVAAVLLIALWVRSYWWCDVTEHRNFAKGWVACSEHGEFLISSISLSSVTMSEWTFSSDPPNRVDNSRETKLKSVWVNQTVGDVSFGGPYWFCVLLAAGGGCPLASLPFHPPYSANRHYAGCHDAGTDRLRDSMRRRA
jgi:hypothetical protein